MRWYVARRLMWAVVVTFIIVSVTWLMLRLTPDQDIIQAGQAAAQAGKNATAEQERLRELRGLNEPLWVQYGSYMENVFTLDWGFSESRSQPVTEAVWTALYYTVQYSVPWTILTIVFGTAAGLYSTAHQYSWRDNLMTFFAFFGFSIPNFWFGIMLLLVFGVVLGWVPITYQTDVGVFTWANFKQLILPVFVLVTGSVGGIQRVSRNESAEYLNTDFVKTARAKGANSQRILTRHILRPASVPMSTTYVGTLLALFTGSSVLVETVFSIPGLGRLLLRGTLSQDTPLVLGTSFVFIFIAVIGNLLQDIVYTVLDPRISFGDR
ncbi:ABC transporter permease [Halorubellus litoreus]|uniref:ABC transporter permease n=1 Tax=Halorubellus litoreus TaxID=755308 RepID=A0ABD5VB02_9EURY